MIASLEALHYFGGSQHTRRALPAEFGAWNRSGSGLAAEPAGVFEAMPPFGGDERHRHLVQMSIRRSCAAHVSAAGAKGAGRAALGRIARRLFQQNHLKFDFDGLPLAFHLTGGEASDKPQLRDPGRHCPASPRGRCSGDKGYDAKANREAGPPARHLPPSRTARMPRQTGVLPKISYKGRAPRRTGVGKIKRFKRIALRCEKTAQNSPPLSRSPAPLSGEIPSTRLV